MRPDDVPHPEMLRNPRFRLRFGKQADALSPQHLQSGEWYDVADLLGAATAPASASELAGEREIVAAFQREHLESASAHSRPASRRSPVRSRMLNSLLTGKLAAALAAAAVGTMGAATAAYADALPDSVQDLAHHLIAAPPAHSHASDAGREHGHEFPTAPASPSPSVSPSHSTSASPSVSPSSLTSQSPLASPSPSISPTPDPAAFGLCTAWGNAVAHHLEHQVGFRDKLSKIAGGDGSDDSITSFCAAVHKPGHDGENSASPSATALASPSPDGENGGNGENGDNNDGNGHNGNGHGNSGQGNSGQGNSGHGGDNAPGRH